MLLNPKRKINTIGAMKRDTLSQHLED